MALLAAATGVAQGADWEVHGVDTAAIDPLRTLSSRYREAAAEVTFHPRTSMAGTPFAAGCFDLVVGQFAIEYGDPSQVLDEVRRVLKAAGRAVFVLHLQESEIVAGATVELAQLGAVQALFAAARGVLEVSARAAPARTQLAAWNRFGRELLRLERLADAHPDRWPVATLREVPAEVRDALAGAVPEPGGPVDPRGVQQCGLALTNHEAMLAEQAHRLATLRAVAPDRDGVEELLQRAARHGLQLLHRADLHDPRGPLIAHTVTLRPSPHP